MRINIGCGATPTEGWLNLDNSASVRLARWPLLVRALSGAGILDPRSSALAEVAERENVRFASALHIPCPDNAADVVYSSHMLEHLDRQEAKAFLLEVRRVLCPHGILRIAVPDLALLVKQYCLSGDADEFIARTHMGLHRPVGFLPQLKAVLIGPRHHLWMYDGSSLCKLLGQLGYADIRIMPPGTSTIPDPGSLDLKERADESVYVEALKPERS